VLEAGNVSYPGTGTPPEGQVRRCSGRTWQGGVISPLLANVFLHEAMDVWFEHTVKPRLNGRARLIRYADDMVFHDRSGGNVTRPPSPTPTAGMLWRDGSAARRRRRARLWPTAADRFSRALRRIAEWCRKHRHLKVREQCPRVRTSEGAELPGQALCLKLNGHFGYYGITGNSAALDGFRYHVKRVDQARSRRMRRAALPSCHRMTAVVAMAGRPRRGRAVREKAARRPRTSLGAASRSCRAGHRPTLVRR